MPRFAPTLRMRYASRRDALPATMPCDSKTRWPRFRRWLELRPWQLRIGIPTICGIGTVSGEADCWPIFGRPRDGQQSNSPGRSLAKSRPSGLFPPPRLLGNAPAFWRRNTSAKGRLHSDRVSRPPVAPDSIGVTDARMVVWKYGTKGNRNSFDSGYPQSPTWAIPIVLVPDRPNEMTGVIGNDLF